MLRPYRTFTVVASLPPQLRPLRELAFNLWWGWNLGGVDLFRRLDGDLWEETGHNPVLLLGKISQERLQEAANDDGFVAQMMRVYQAFNRYMGSTDTWYSRLVEKATYQDLPQGKMAYFSMEFGLTECLKTYSGGLGVLAGDHLKSASDLGLPLVGVSLLYQNGFFQQYLNADGWQQESHPRIDFHNLPLILERDHEGQPVKVQVEYPGRVVAAQVWRIQVGRVPLYMLDANLPENAPHDRAITSQLYGGDVDMRIRQEIMLGIGGVRALEALGIEPSICHMNEGHSAFLGLERIRRAMQSFRTPGKGLSFDESLELMASSHVFTTHTPVPAGIDKFSAGMMDQYFTSYYQSVGITRDRFLALGRGENAHPDESFSMAVLAIRISSSYNGVSKLHGEVARDMWKDLWPGTPAEEVPISSVTNGIHTGTWISLDMASLLLRYLGPRWVERPEDTAIWERIDRVPDEELWRTHERRRERLVAIARDRLHHQLQSRGATAQEQEQAAEVLNPEALTIGFARRFATYKRALLLFRDPERLSRLLNDPQRPVQILFAGKAHPHDNPGKEFIRQLIHLTRREDLRRRVLFLEGYDMNLARYMVQGADVWLNTPRVGQEASGTSGMKSALNGGLHVSTFDGWWHEGYTPQVGWRVGSGETYIDESYGDEVEAQALYNLLEQDIIPLFYARGGDGLPRGWIAKMKNAMRDLAPFFNTHRMVQDYTKQHYLPLGLRYAKLRANEGTLARELAAWRQKMNRYWGDIRIVSVESSATDDMPVTSEMAIRAVVSLGGSGQLSPEDITLQVFHGPVDAAGQIAGYAVEPLSLHGQDGTGNHIYEGSVVCDSSGLHGFTLRILPYHAALSCPYVPKLVIWSN